MAKRRVLVTGAAGYVAERILPALRERYDLCLIDSREEDRRGRPVEGIRNVDLLTDDPVKMAPLFSGIDTTLHLAYHQPVSDDPQTAYAGERLNLDMMQLVFQLSFDFGVKRVIAASSDQAATCNERSLSDGSSERVSPEAYPRPANFYGWSKAASEMMGFLYASGGMGRKLEAIHLRIAAPREIDPGLPKERFVRDLAGYVSQRDLQQLFVKSIETPGIEDERGIPFRIFYGVSNNARSLWNIDNARKTIGYEPEDDSEVRFAKDVARVLRERKGGDGE
jgi:hypothetical protein